MVQANSVIARNGIEMERHVIFANTKLDKTKIETIPVEVIKSSTGSITVRLSDLPGYYDFVEVTLPRELL